MRSFFILVFLFSFKALSADGAFDYKIDSQKISQVANSVYWHRLLHYQPRFLQQARGESDDPFFYLSREGRLNPLAELEADVRAFATTEPTGRRKTPAQCTFPERYRYLKAALKLNINDLPCPDFQKWKKTLDARSATLIFASSFLGNPASMFGHTFLRIDSTRSARVGQGNDLLGYGLSYGVGNTNHEPVFKMVVFGVVGGYDGYFVLSPYFEKVNEYTDGENRDLWEYHLNLSPEQMDRMINHIWEISAVSFPYFFFDKNCSSQVLELLEVANPNWNLSDRFLYFTIPVDTLRALTTTPGAISQTTYRPSLYKQISKKIANFSPEEVKSFELAKTHNLQLSGSESALVLDTLIELQDYNALKAKKSLDDSQRQIRRKILLARAKRSESTASLSVSPPATKPDEGTQTAKLSTYFDSFADHNSVGIKMRPALHDLLDWDDGYQEFSKVVLGEFDLRYLISSSQLLLHEVTLAQITSLNPMSSINHALSWDVRAALTNPSDLRCQTCLATELSAGAGVSRFLLQEQRNFLAYSMLNVVFEAARDLQQGFRVGPSLELGVLGFLPEHLKLGPTLTGTYFFNQSKVDSSFIKVGLTGSWTIRSVDLELRLQSQFYSTSERGHFFDNSIELSHFF